MKKTVYTLTPNPALDLSGVVDELKPDEKAYVRDEKRAPGGNAINVARVLTRLQTPVVASGFLGGGTGQEIRYFLEREKVRTHFVKIAGSSRVNVTVSNARTHKQTRLSFKGPPILADEKERLMEYLRTRRDMSALVIGGSLPQGFLPQDVKKLIHFAHAQNIPVIVDCPAEILRQTISLKPSLIKPNLEEFQELTHSRVKTIGAVAKKAKNLLEKIPMICISSVEEGTLLITREQIFFGRIPPTEIHSTVGAGDSLLGAMVAQIHAGQTAPENLLRWGLAAAAATLGRTGTELGQAREIQNLYKKTRVIAVEL